MNRRGESIATLDDNDEVEEEEEEEEGEDNGPSAEEDLEFKSCRDVDYDEDRSFLTGIDPDAEGKGEGEYLGVNADVKKQNVYDQVRLGFDMSIDKLGLRLDTFSESKKAFVPFVEVAILDVEIAAGIDVTVEDSEAALNFNLALGELLIVDGLQEHTVLGRHLAMEDKRNDKLKQLCMKATYGMSNELVQFTDIRRNQLSIGLQLNDMYVLATALAVLASNLQMLFDFGPL